MTNYFDIRNSTFGLRIVLANPPFNDSDWFRKDDDVRWQYGVPPRGNANFAWVQHFIHHLAPLFFWNKRMPQGQITRGDRQRLSCC